MRLLRGATITAADPDASASRYCLWFGYQQLAAGTITATQAAGWGLPAMTGRRFVTIGPASGVDVTLRFIAGETPADYQPLRSYGWGAIELCVQDVQAVHERMKDSPFEIIGPPRALDGDPKIWPMQVRGPDGEVVFLTEIRGDDPGARLPRAACLVDGLFIAVLACADIAHTRQWFAEQLGLEGGPDFELAYTTLSRAFGLPVGHKHKIAVLGHGGDAFLQIDQYPPGAIARAARPGQLPPGVAMVSFAAPGGGGRVLSTPEGTLVELVT